MARCQGHQSYVTGVAFDPWRCDERNYRFGSVGEDAKLLLWDFSVGALHKPKAVSGQVPLSSILCTLGTLELCTNHILCFVRIGSSKTREHCNCARSGRRIKWV